MVNLNESVSELDVIESLFRNKSRPRLQRAKDEWASFNKQNRLVEINASFPSIVYMFAQSENMKITKKIYGEAINDYWFHCKIRFYEMWFNLTTLYELERLMPELEEARELRYRIFSISLFNLDEDDEYDLDGDI